MGAAGGTHHNYGTVAADTITGATGGAAIGTAALPGVGTAVGAGLGAVGGFLTGLFTGDSPAAVLQPQAPPAPPDLADELARRGEIAQQMRLMGDGAGNFLAGPLGDPSQAPTYKPRAGGA